jgi:hypothetical protein
VASPRPASGSPSVPPAAAYTTPWLLVRCAHQARTARHDARLPGRRRRARCNGGSRRRALGAGEARRWSPEGRSGVHQQAPRRSGVGKPQERSAAARKANAGKLCRRGQRGGTVRQRPRAARESSERLSASITCPCGKCRVWALRCVFSLKSVWLMGHRECDRDRERNE